jgi:RimJ/RimL family protein N-acetyltransferase
VRQELETLRLRLRRWRDEDFETFVRWHADPQLMRHMGKPTFPREEVKGIFERHQLHWEEHGFGLWAAEEKETGALVGRVGLAYHRLWPADPEVGWLIDPARQGRGLATEAGAACIDYGFGELGFPRIVSICMPENLTSRRVMEKLGLRPWQELEDPTLRLTLLLHVREGTVLQ